VHPTHLLPVRGRRAPSRRQGTREGIHSEARWRAFYAERKCEFRVLFSARAAQNEFFIARCFGPLSVVSDSPIIGDTLPRDYHSERAGPGSLVLLIGDTLPRASHSELAGPGSVVLLIGDKRRRASRSERAGLGSLVRLIGDTLPAPLISNARGHAA